jgi:putative (di)nucleoside polyphosphate hydrolase
MHEQNCYFRAGVGTVIYNAAGQVAWFRRGHYPVGVWQFQQGGIGSGESIEQTLWRELHEEVGITPHEVVDIIQYPRWTVCAYSPEIMDKEDNRYKDRLGQAHRWFFLKLKPEVTIDMSCALEDEFTAHKWIDFEDAIEETITEKKSVYEELYEFFKKIEK